MRLTVTKRQKAFLDATATEVLFGGAAGGGKSRGQLIDAFLFALTHPASKQLILRRTFPELEKSLIRESLALYPKSVYTYHATGHTGRFPTGSLIDFGYCATENDVFQYQSAEYDVIRFDELTHFTEFQYLYLMSRVRGANRYPKQIKSSTNPGGVGHGWVKARFIDPAPPDTVFTPERGGRTTASFCVPIRHTASVCSPSPSGSGGRCSSGTGTSSTGSISGNFPYLRPVPAPRPLAALSHNRLRSRPPRVSLDRRRRRPQRLSLPRGL